MLSAPRPGADFSERWRGDVAGRKELALNLTIVARDLEALLGNPAYRAEVHGTAGLMVQGSAPRIFRVTGGIGMAPEQIAYELELTAGGERMGLRATRQVTGQPRPDAFSQTATLAVTEPPELAGTLRRSADDWTRGLGSLRIYNIGPGEDASRMARADALARRLAGPIADVYANVAAEPRAFAPKAMPVKRRSLLAPAPEVEYFDVGGRLLRLVRYPRSPGRPVLLIHSLGQSSRFFSLSSLQPNMVEFLHAWGFDVWLLDDRGSNALSGALQPFDLDQIASLDLPAAMQRIAATTRADGVIVLAHGWGAAAAWMWLVSGKADGVAAYVSSQVGPLVDAGPGLSLGSRAHTATFWRLVGSAAAGGYKSGGPGAAAWRLASSRRGRNASSIVTSVYGQVMRGSNLSPQAQAAVPYLYGPVAVGALEHVQAIARAGRVVDAGGKDSYLPGAALPAIPILMLHGAENRLSLKSGLDRSVRWLRDRSSLSPEVALIAGYGHDDSMIGQLAPSDVFPTIRDFLRPFRVGG